MRDKLSLEYIQAVTLTIVMGVCIAFTGWLLLKPAKVDADAYVKAFDSCMDDTRLKVLRNTVDECEDHARRVAIYAAREAE